MHFLNFLLWVIFVDCIGSGLAVATLLWWASNRFMRTDTVHGVEQRLEWAYAFDVHCNAFFPLLLVVHIVQLFLLPVILSSFGFLSLLLGNTLWLVGLMYYVYITFLGYNGAALGACVDAVAHATPADRSPSVAVAAMPFLDRNRTVMLLYPGAAFVLIYILSLVLQWNISYAVFGFYKLL